MLFDLLPYLFYLCLILWLVYRNGFFGLFGDDKLTHKQYALIFLFKAMAVPVFYYVYKKLYGGIDNLDAGKFYHDVQVIHQGAMNDFGFYVRLMFGLQQDLPGTADFENCLKDTLNWDNGTAKDYLYNDNRVLIRVHSLIEFISFHSYFVHGLMSCLLSYIGLQKIYRVLKPFFGGKEIILMLLLCFVPALWFYTGALLKEGLTVFVLGHLLYYTRQAITMASVWEYLKLLPYVAVAIVLKPYLLLFAFVSFLFFFILQYKSLIVHKAAFYFSGLVLVILTVNFLSIQIKHRSLAEAAKKHQRIFAGVAKGGIFLAKDDVFIRLNNDSTLIIPVKDKKNFVTIRKGVKYMYWEHNQDQDTLYCAENKDTASVYELKYTIQESHSNIDVSTLQGSSAGMVWHAFYYSLFFPMFVQAKGMMQMLASLENLAILAALLFLVYFLFRSRQSAFLPLVLLFVCLAICFLVGLATPNSGAIYRYRSPVISFIFIALLYYLPETKKQSGTN